MDVDEAGDPTPTNEWMEAAQRAVDTDGILENAAAKRQKVCKSCNTLTALHLQTPSLGGMERLSTCVTGAGAPPMAVAAATAARAARKGCIRRVACSQKFFTVQL